MSQVRDALRRERDAVQSDRDSLRRDRDAAATHTRAMQELLQQAQEQLAQARESTPVQQANSIKGKASDESSRDGGRDAPGACLSPPSPEGGLTHSLTRSARRFWQQLADRDRR